jgi:hypothetical protein
MAVSRSFESRSPPMGRPAYAGSLEFEISSKRPIFSISPKLYNGLLMKLSLRPHDDLNWQIEGKPDLFEFELGLNDPYFPLEDELTFQSIAAGLTHFTKEVWPRFEGIPGILYRGSADFSRFFFWSEKQLANFAAWKEERPVNDEAHLKRLFCAEAFVAYFQMLAHKLPDEMHLKIVLDRAGTGTPAEMLHLLSPERFDHFTLESGLNKSSSVGLLFPDDGMVTQKLLKKIDRIIPNLPEFRAVYEPLLTEQWDGLDELLVFPEVVTMQGKRKLAGFLAAGGKVVEFGAEGFEPPTYWSQTSRASQTALYPVV